MDHFPVFGYSAIFGGADRRSELEDERRQLIVGRASLWAFTAMVGATLIEMIETTAGLSDGAPLSPFVRLTAAAVMYAIFLGWFKHKYGG